MRKSSRGNPYHDRRGRFTTKDGNGTGTVNVCECGRNIQTDNPDEVLRGIADDSFYKKRAAERMEKEYFRTYKTYLIDGDDTQMQAFYKAKQKLRDSGYTREEITDLNVKLTNDLYGAEEEESEERAIRNLQRLEH